MRLARRSKNRSGSPDPRGGYLDVWVYPQAQLTSEADDFLKLRGLWCEGPKKSLRWPAQFDATTHTAFVIALRPSASDDAIRALVERVAGGVVS